MDHLVDQAGAVDVLVNNAELSWFGPTAELDVAIFDRLFRRQRPGEVLPGRCAGPENGRPGQRQHHEPREHAEQPDEAGHADHVLRALNDWGSEGRRILRSFLGRWLDDQLVSGPDDDLRARLIDQLARQGWYEKNGNLVSGEPARGSRVSRPILRGARLAALHPQIAQAAENLLKDGHRAAAVFEAAKALNNRVKAMTALTSDGASLMGTTFSTDKPHLVLADLSTATGRDIQNGYRFLFMGTQAAIRNPHAHEPFADIDEDEALELLALTSQLMRRLDRATHT